MLKIKYLLALSFAISAINLIAQVGGGGIPLSWTNALNAPAKYEHPYVDNSTLMDTLPCAEQDTMKCAEFFGKGFEILLSPDSSGTWDTLPNGSLVWRLELKSSSAKSVFLRLDKVSLDSGESIFFYGNVHDSVALFGAFTDYHNNSDSIFVSPAIDSNSITIEYNVLPYATGSLPKFRIAHLVHGIRKAWGDLNDYTLPCHNNVNCMSITVTFAMKLEPLFNCLWHTQP